MQKKLIKKIFCIILMLVLVIAINSSVYAISNKEVIVDGSTLTNNDYAEKVIQNPLRGNILNQGMARLSDNGNGTVNVYGAVFGSAVCDKLILELTLQRYENGYWINVKSFSDTVQNQSLLTKSYNVSVTKGHYYRIKAACVAIKGSTSESQMPVTNGIWIN